MSCYHHIPTSSMPVWFRGYSTVWVCYQLEIFCIRNKSAKCMRFRREQLSKTSVKWTLLCNQNYSEKGSMDPTFLPCCLASSHSLFLAYKGRLVQENPDWSLLAMHGTLTWISGRAGTRNQISSLLVHLPIYHETKKIGSTLILLDHHDRWITIGANWMPGMPPGLTLP